jgi:hypothetical protein
MLHWRRENNITAVEVRVARRVGHGNVASWPGAMHSERLAPYSDTALCLGAYRLISAGFRPLDRLPLTDRPADLARQVRDHDLE